MTGRNHIKIGFSVSVLTLNPVIILYTLLGSILPDIDHCHSKISGYIPAPFIFRNNKHRGFTHSFIALCSVAVFCFFVLIDKNMTYGIVIGYGTHLLADMLTARDIQLLWPLRKRCGFWIDFSTGSKAEDIFADAMLMLSGYILYRMLIMKG